MELLNLTFRFLHFVGLAILIGGATARLIQPTDGLRRLVFYGALVQLVTGVVLIFANLDDDLDHLKVTVKLVILLVIIGVLHMKKLQARPAGSWVVLLLGVLNTGLAVFW